MDELEPYPPINWANVVLVVGGSVTFFVIGLIVGLLIM